MKKILYTVILLVLFALPAWADVTVTTPDIGKTSQGGSFIINAYSANAAGCEQLKAAPGTGKAIYIRNLTVNAASPITVTIGEGETTAGSVDTVLIGPLQFGTNSDKMAWDFYPALKLTDNKSLVVDTSATGPVVIIIQGFIE